MLSNAMFDVGGSFGHSTVIGVVINPVKWGLVSSSSSSNMGGCRAVRGCTAVVGKGCGGNGRGRGRGCSGSGSSGERYSSSCWGSIVFAFSLLEPNLSRGLGRPV